MAQWVPFDWDALYCASFRLKYLFTGWQRFKEHACWALAMCYWLNVWMLVELVFNISEYLLMVTDLWSSIKKKIEDSTFPTICYLSARNSAGLWLSLFPLIKWNQSVNVKSQWAFCRAARWRTIRSHHGPPTLDISPMLDISMLCLKIAFLYCIFLIGFQLIILPTSLEHYKRFNGNRGPQAV